MVGVYPHVFPLAINPDRDDPNLIELSDRLPALEAFGAVPRRLKKLFDVHFWLQKGCGARTDCPNSPFAEF